MDNKVEVKYLNYSSHPIVGEISFEILSDVLVGMKYDEERNGVVMSMQDAITANTELEGLLTYDKLNDLIRGLTQIRNQLKKGDEKNNAVNRTERHREQHILHGSDYRQFR